MNAGFLQKCKVNMNSLNGFRTIQFKDLAEHFT